MKNCTKIKRLCTKKNKEDLNNSNSIKDNKKEGEMAGKKRRKITKRKPKKRKVTKRRPKTLRDYVLGR